MSDSFSLLTQLNGHHKVITGIALPSCSNRLYSGSKDETVRIWDCQTGQCVGEANVGGEVDCMLNEGSWVFAGIPNTVKAWNTHMNTEMSLTGPVGQVYTMTVANEILFTGTHDGRILIWKFNVQSNCFEPMASLTGHTLPVVSIVVGALRLYSDSMDNTIRVITGIALPLCSNRLYSGSKDETVRVWDCQTGQCVGEANVGGEVGCMLSEGPWVFAGIPNAVKAWNTHMNTEMSLTGPAGQVYTMTVANEMLFAGTHDGRILIWKFNVQSNCFEPMASLTGHTLPVVSIVVGALRLYSGSMDNTIRVWDLTSLQCIQTLTDHTSVVMSMLCWDQFLISCSLDQTIKIWVVTESGKLEVTYTHTEEHGVLALCGMHDDKDKPVLLCSCNDNSIRLYDLPSFSERGKIFSKKEVRAMQSGPGVFFTGDGTGELKVWKWSTNETPAT